jgi:hypothetical protein
LLKAAKAAAIAVRDGKNEVTATSRVGAAQTSSDGVGAVRIAGAIADRIGVDAATISDSVFLISLTTVQKLWFAGRTRLGSLKPLKNPK